MEKLSGKPATPLVGIGCNRKSTFYIPWIERPQDGLDKTKNILLAET